MKAAAEAWGMPDTDAFRRGFAKQTADPDIVAAAMAKPGLVLKRAVGTNDIFSEDPRLPRHLLDGLADSPRERRPKAKHRAQSAEPEARKEAPAAFERERRRRESQRQREEAARERQRKKQAEAVSKAEKALKDAERRHQKQVERLTRERALLDKRTAAEDVRWEKAKKKLEATLRRANFS
jgi:hypothetical protein